MVPLPPPVPMFSEIVPVRVPVPDVKDTVTIRFALRPTVDRLPNASAVLTTGCCPNTWPAVARPGCVVKTSTVAVAATTVIGDWLPVIVALTVSVAVTDVVGEAGFRGTAFVYVWAAPSTHV